MNTHTSRSVAVRPGSMRRAAFDVRDSASALLDPACYPDRPDAVQLRETLISSVFLAGDFAYKLKKPVNLGFVDYTTVARRRRFCEREVELNRRLADSIYLAVVPLVRTGAGLRFEAPGRALDWAVKMQHVPDEALWSSRLEAGTLDASDMQRLGALLAGFHARVPVVRSPRLLAAADEAWDGNLEELGRFVPDLLSSPELVAIHELGARRRADLAPALRRRLRAGRFVDGHGDLRLEHLCDFTGHLQVLDCVEFNRDLRRVDAAADLAFLLMDLDRNGRQDLAVELAAAYLRASGDASATLVDRFYRAERALVRAKVDALAQERPGSSQTDVSRLRARARRLIERATRYVEPGSAPALIVVWGLSGAGKTHLATRLAASIGAAWLSTDYVRKRDTGLKLAARLDADAYRRDARLAIYARLHREAAWYLRRGFAVIVDGTYLDAGARTAAERLAAHAGVPALALSVECSPETLHQRVHRREAETGASDATWAVVAEQLTLHDRQRFTRIPTARLNGEQLPDAVLQNAIDAITGVMKPDTPAVR